MGSGASDYLENTLLDSVLGRKTTALSTATNSTLFVALLTIAYADSWTPLATGECAGSTYARVAVANSSAQWRLSTGGSVTNKATLTFTTAAGADWGTIKSAALVDTSSTTTGNFLWGADLTGGDEVIASGNTVSFATGALVVTQS